MSPINKKYKTQAEEISDLKEYIARLEDNKQKLVESLTMKKRKDEIFNVNLSESDLTHFHRLEKNDQKILGILYWEKLTDDQKKVFTDYEEMELRKRFEKVQHDIMADPTKMRQYFLQSAAPILDDILKYATGDKAKTGADSFAFREVWEVLKGIITSASSPAPLMNLKGKEISDQIDEILTGVTNQKITFDQAKELMSLVSQGFNMQQLPVLLAKLEQLESN